MAVSSYIRGGAKAVRKGISNVGSYLLKPVDRLIEKDKQMQEARRKSAPAYNRMKEEEDRKKREEEMKKDMETKDKGTPKTKSYVKKRYA